MIVKNIKTVLTKKLDDLLDSIEDKNIKKIFKENVIITGGCIPSMLESKPINDFDIYFRTKEATFKIAEYYVNKFKNNPPTKLKDSGIIEDIILIDEDLDIEQKSKTNYYESSNIPVPEKKGRIKIKVQSAGVASEEDSDNYEYFEGLDDVQRQRVGDYVEKSFGVLKKEGEEEEEEKKYRPIFLSSNAITLSNKVQLIIRFYGEPEDIHKNYDFVHCTNYWTSWNKELVLKKDALASLITKELRYEGSKYPLCSIIRTRKFINKGWLINAGQYLKMCMQLNELDLNNINVLEDQLCGVDVAYFKEVIELMREYGKEHGDENKIDTSYLFEVIDRLF